MQQQKQTFLERLMGKSKTIEAIQSAPVHTTSYSQPHVLQHRMNEQGLKHGDTVIADLSPVRIERHGDKNVMYFCPMQSISILKKIEYGDGRRLPEDAKLVNISVPATLQPGLYKIRNVTLFSNGTMQVIANAKTYLESFDGGDRINVLSSGDVVTRMAPVIDELPF